jgi:anti-anti-sigma factor
VTPLAHVDVDADGDVVVAHVTGEIDASNAAEIGRRLRGAVTNSSHALVVDLLATSYLDSAAINILFAIASELEQRRQRLHVVVGHPVSRVLEITGVPDVAPMYASVDDALQAERAG